MVFDANARVVVAANARRCIPSLKVERRQPLTIGKYSTYGKRSCIMARSLMAAPALWDQRNEFIG